MDTIAPFAGAYAVGVGLMLGSFINLAADRLPRGESLVAPRSHCRACGRILNFLDLLPVAGYLMRGGRCATCRTLIGVGSPLVEAASGGLVLLAIVWQGVWPGAMTGLVMVLVFGVALVGLALRPGSRLDRASGQARRVP